MDLHRHQSHDDLVEEIERLRAELDGIRYSAVYMLAQTLDGAIAEIVDDEDVALHLIRDEVDSAVDAALKDEVTRRSRPLIKRKKEEAIRDQTDEIDREAEEVAERAAAEAVARFESHDAEAYRASRIAQRTRVVAATAILGAKGVIDAELGSHDVDAGLEPAVEVESREDLKARAADIRHETHRSKVLPFSLLRDGDTITLCFVSRGMGNEQYTTGGYYGSSTYNNSLESRRLAVRVLDREQGLFEVEDDSWFKGHRADDKSIRPGTRIFISANDPIKRRPASLIVKAEPVEFDAYEGGEVMSTDNEVWWASLGDFKILS